MQGASEETSSWMGKSGTVYLISGSESGCVNTKAMVIYPGFASAVHLLERIVAVGELIWFAKSKVDLLTENNGFGMKSCLL